MAVQCESNQVKQCKSCKNVNSLYYWWVVIICICYFLWDICCKLQEVDSPQEAYQPPPDIVMSMHSGTCKMLPDQMAAATASLRIDELRP